MLDLRSWITLATANPVTNNVQILHRNKPQTIIKSRTIKETEVECYPTKVKIDSKSHGNCYTFSLCLLSLSQKLKAPSDPAVANV